MQMSSLKGFSNMYCRTTAAMFGCKVLKIPRRWFASRLVSVVENEKNNTATLVMQHPPVNSLNLELVQEITKSIKELEKKKCRGFVLSSNLTTVFSAGLDIMELYKAEEKRLKEFLKSLEEMHVTLYLTPLITIAAINGHAPAAGCMLALDCDHRVMLNGKATIGLNETQLGIIPPKWLSVLLINNIGFRPAEKALTFGTLFSPEQALSLGLVDDVVSSSAALKEKVSYQMEMYLKIPDAARRGTKLSLRKKFVDDTHTYQDEKLEDLVKNFQSESVQRSLEKYLENLKKKE